MGSGRWSDKEWEGYTTSKSYSTKATHEIFDKRHLDPLLDPKGVKVRESRDSVDNPVSSALIVALDVTGSMQPVIDAMARKGLNTLATEVYDRKPITDPHLMFMGIGDVEFDRAPLQVTQFEADIRIAEQLEKLYLEGGGGGNQYESYMLAWYFAAYHTAIDCFGKRGKKGYLFTIGDEGPTPHLSRDHINDVLGYRPQIDVDRDTLLTYVSRQWEVFHVMVAEGNFASTHRDSVKKQWTELLGQQAIWLEDHTKLAEVIVSVMQVREGVDHTAVVKSWDHSTAMVVKSATEKLTKRDAATAGAIVSL